MSETKNNEFMKGRIGRFLNSKADEYSDFFTPLFSFIDDREAKHSLMRTDIVETKDNYSLDIEVPGIKKDELKISLDEGYLKVSYTLNREEKDTQEKKFYHIERRKGYYSREYFVGYDVNQKDITASLNDGILNITIPKVKAKREDEKYIKID